METIKWSSNTLLWGIGFFTGLQTSVFYTSVLPLIKGKVTLATINMQTGFHSLPRHRCDEVLLSSSMEGAEWEGTFVLWDCRTFSGWLKREYPDTILEIGRHMCIWLCSWYWGYRRGKSHSHGMCPSSFHFLFSFIVSMATADRCSLTCIVPCVSYWCCPSSCLTIYQGLSPKVCFRNTLKTYVLCRYV